MAESAENSADPSSATKAVKDKKCQFCGQAFTSSSLGRHLDLYIREKNRKAPDGIHDVEAIARMRVGITRRKPKGYLLRGGSSTPSTTPKASSKDSPAPDADSSTAQSPVQQRESQNPAELTANLYPFQPRWEATGVMNDLPAKAPEPLRRRDGDDARDPAGQPAPSRTVSRQMTKAQLDMKQRIQDAMDTSRASELALREMIGSWRAAKQHIDMNSMPFDFDPLSLDFPALALQCLQPPPTLFCSTQHSTPTSWSIAPPGARECEALQMFFGEEFRKYKISCAAATTAVQEDLVYPPPASSVQVDVKDAVRRAERIAESLERQVSDHLLSAYTMWDGLEPQRRSELWVLELARGIGRKHKETEKLKETQHSLKQEVAHLKSQLEHLNRLQQPREFKLFSPTTVPMSEHMLKFLHEEAVTKGRRGVGLNIDDRHSDLNTVVATAIDRWKNVIVSNRAASGMSAQRALTQTPAPTPGSQSLSSTSAATSPAVAKSVPPIPQQIPPPPVPTLQQPPGPRQLSYSAAPVKATPPAPASATARFEQAQAGSTPSARSVEDEDMSDQDADAEMEVDDEFSQMHTPVTRRAPVPQQHTPHLEVQRTRVPVQRMAAGGANGNFAVNGARVASRPNPGGAPPVDMGQAMPNVHPSVYGRHGRHVAHPGVTPMNVKSDPMYMD